MLASRFASTTGVPLASMLVSALFLAPAVGARDARAQVKVELSDVDLAPGGSGTVHVLLRSSGEEIVAVDLALSAGASAYEITGREIPPGLDLVSQYLQLGNSVHAVLISLQCPDPSCSGGSNIPLPNGALLLSCDVLAHETPGDYPLFCDSVEAADKDQQDVPIRCANNATVRVREPVATAIPTQPQEATPTATAIAPCVGDCDGADGVTIGEVIMGASISIGTMDLRECTAIDADTNGRVEIGELVLAVTNSLDGSTLCSARAATR